MSRTIQFGMVGYGSRGANMLRIAAGFDNVNVAAICENNPERMEQARKDYPENTIFFTDYEEMLQSGKVDTVLVETPADNHASFCKLALEKNLNVMSDVPCVYSYDEAEMLWQTQKQSDGMFMFGANPNMWGFVQAAVDMKEKGLLGKPYFLEAEYIHDIRSLFAKTPWRKTFKPIIYCTHSLGPLLRLIDEDIRYVSCFDSGSHINDEPGQHDVMTAIFRTESNIVLRVTCSFINNFKGGCHWYRVMGTKGCFERTAGRGDLDKPRVLFNSEEMYGADAITELPVEYFRPEYKGTEAQKTGHGGADYAMFDHFFKALQEKTPSPICLREGIRMSLPGIFAAISAENGGELTEVKYPWD